MGEWEPADIYLVFWSKRVKATYSKLYSEYAKGGMRVRTYLSVSRKMVDRRLEMRTAVMLVPDLFCN